MAWRGEDDLDDGDSVVSGTKVSEKQWFYLLNAVQGDKELAGSFSGPLGRGRFTSKWAELATELNKIGPVQKSGIQWQVAYTGLRSRAKTALALKTAQMRATGGGNGEEDGGPLTSEKLRAMGLNAYYIKSLEIHGTVSALGNQGVSDPLQLQRQYVSKQNSWSRQSGMRYTPYVSPRRQNHPQRTSPHGQHYHNYPTQSPRFSESRSRFSEKLSPRFPENRSPRFSDNRSLRFSEKRSPRFSEKRSPRFSEKRSPRFAEKRSPLFSEKFQPRFSEKHSPRYERHPATYTSVSSNNLRASGFENDVVLLSPTDSSKKNVGAKHDYFESQSTKDSSAAHPSPSEEKTSIRKKLFDGLESEGAVKTFVEAINAFTTATKDLTVAIAANTDAVNILAGHIYNQVIE